MQFTTILADPPWSYKSKKSGGSFKSGAAQKYDCMDTDELASLPIQLIAAPKSYLFLWAVVPMLGDAIRLMENWSFTYRTSLFWDKERFGLGYWFRGQVEVLLVGTHGPARCIHNSGVRNLHREKPKGHSEKPEYYLDLIESTYPGPSIELFARRARSGWTTLGYELGRPVNMETLADLSLRKEEA